MNTLLVDRCWIRVAALSTLLGASVFAAQAPLKVGDPFPELAAQQLEGKLPDALKGKIVLVDFWASWCAPCAKSFPAMEEIHNKYRDRGLVVIGISVDEKASDMQSFLKKHPVTFPILRDAAQKLVAFVDAASMPTSYLLDGDGKIRFIHNGYHGEVTRKQYATEIESLLKGKP